jgi:hypothetical protein
MSFASRYDISFYDRTDHFWFVEIQQRGYAGPRQDVTAGTPALLRHFGASDTELVGWHRGSSVEMTIFDEGGTLFSDIFDAYEDDWRIAVYRDSVLMFYGTLLTQNVVVPAHQPPFFVNLEAVDGLYRLQSIPFSDTDDEDTGDPLPMEGRATVVNVITSILGRLDYGLAVEFNCEWYPSEVAGTFADVEVDQSIFTDDKGRPLDCYVVLEQLMMRFGLEIFQESGKWQVTQHERFADDTFTLFEVDGTDGYTFKPAERGFRPLLRSVQVTYDHDVVNLAVDGDFPDTAFDRDDLLKRWTAAGGVLHEKYGKPLYSIYGRTTGSRVRNDPRTGGGTGVVRRAGDGPSSRPGSRADLPPSEGVFIKNADASVFEGRVVSKTLPVELATTRYIESEAVLIEEIEERYLSIGIKLGSFLEYTGEDPEGVETIRTAFRVKVGTYYLRDQFGDGVYTWTTDESFITVDIPLSRGGFIESLFELKILTPELPESGEFTVRLYEVYDSERKYAAGEFNEIGQQIKAPGPYNAERFKRPTGVVYESFVVELADADNKTIGSQITTAVNADGRATTTAVIPTLFIGDGPTTAHARRLTVDGGQSNNEWNATEQNIDEVLARYMLLRQIRNVQVLSARIRADILATNALEFLSKRMRWINVTHDARESEWSGEFIEVLDGLGGVTVKRDTDERYGGFVSNAPGVGFFVDQSGGVLNSFLAAAFTRTTALIPAGVRANIKVLPTSSGLRAGATLTLIHPFNFTPYNVVLAEDFQVGDTEMVIDPFDFEDDIPFPAAVYATAEAINSWFVQNENGVGIGVRRALAGGAVCSLTADVEGVVDTLSVTPTRVKLREGDPLYIVPTDPEKDIVYVVVSADTDAGSEVLPIEEQYVDALEEDPVLVDAVYTRAQLLIQPDAVQASVEDYRGGYAFTRLTTNYAGSGYTSLAVQAIPSAVKAGDKLHLASVRFGTATLVTLTADASVGATTLAIAAADLTYEVGDVLNVADSTNRAAIIVNADRISQTVERTSFSGAIGFLDGDVSNATASTIPVRDVTVELKEDDILYILNKEDMALTTVWVAADFSTTSGTLSIKANQIGGTVDVQALDGSGLHMAIGHVRSIQLQQADLITSVVQRFSQNNVICTLSSAVSGTVTSLPVTGLGVDLKDGDQFVVYDIDTLEPFFVQLSADVSSGASSLPIDSATVNAGSGSGVHLRESFARSQILQTADEVRTAVTRFAAAGALATLTSGVSGTITSLPVTALPVEVEDNDQLYIVDADTGLTYEVQANGSASLSATSVTIDSASVTAASGSGLYFREALFRSLISVTASSITNAVEAVSLGGRIAVLSADASGTVTSLSVSGLSTPLDPGDDIYVIDIATGEQFTATIATSAAAGSSPIQINSTTVNAATGSGVHISAATIRSQTVQTAEALEDVVEAFSLGGAIATTTSNYSGSTTGINITGLSVDVYAGDLLYVVNKDTGATYGIELTADREPGDLTLNIVSANVVAPAGSGVHVNTGYVRTVVQQTADSISQTVTRFSEAGAFATITSVLSGTPTTSLPVTALPYELKDGDIIYVVNADTGETYECEVSSDTAAAATAIHILSLSVFAIIGSGVHIAGGYMRSQILQTADSIRFKVGDGNLLSEISIELDSITIDTDLLKSNNYVAGTSGWAIDGDGSAEFDDINARGSFYSFGTWVSGSNPASVFLDSGQLQFNVVYNTLDLEVFGSMQGLGIEFLVEEISSGDPLNKLTLHSQLLQFEQWNGSSWTQMVRIENPSTGNASMAVNGNITSQTYQVPRYRGKGTTASRNALSNLVAGDFHITTDLEPGGVCISFYNGSTWDNTINT